MCLATSIFCYHFNFHSIVFDISSISNFNSFMKLSFVCKNSWYVLLIEAILCIAIRADVSSLIGSNFGTWGVFDIDVSA